MSIEEIKTIVKEHIDQALQGQSKESLKFEFKYKWPNLKDPRELNEFLKDITAMANTYGPDGFIVYGFDDDAKKFNDVQFTDCELKDDSQLFDLQSRYLSNNFDLNEYDETIDGHQLSILHFPPTLHKPILIKNYRTFHKDGHEKRSEEHKIFVRNGTTIRTAKKEDLELMSYDRKNIVPEYDFQVALLELKTRNMGDARAVYELTIENTGRRPISLRKIRLIVETENGIYQLTASQQVISNNLPNSMPNLYVKPNDIRFFQGEAIVFTPGGQTTVGMVHQIKQGKDVIAELVLTNGKTFRVKAEITNREKLDL